jgi:hypothetical protein
VLRFDEPNRSVWRPGNAIAAVSAAQATVGFFHIGLLFDKQ